MPCKWIIVERADDTVKIKWLIMWYHAVAFSSITIKCILRNKLIYTNLSVDMLYMHISTCKILSVIRNECSAFTYTCVKHISIIQMKYMNVIIGNILSLLSQPSIFALHKTMPTFKTKLTFSYHFYFENYRKKKTKNQGKKKTCLGRYVEAQPVA